MILNFSDFIAHLCKKQTLKGCHDSKTSKKKLYKFIQNLYKCNTNVLQMNKRNCLIIKIITFLGLDF